MKRLAMIGTLIAAAALTAAPGASAVRGHDTLRVRIRRPVVFLNATAACPWPGARGAPAARMPS